MLRRWYIFWVCLAVATIAAAKEPKVRTVIHAWQMTPYTALADTVPIDTSYINHPLHEIQRDYSVSSSTNGNSLVSPMESRVFFDRQTKIDDIFATSLQPYVITPRDVRYYNTTIPYSSVAYNKGFVSYHEENEIKFMFTGNLGRRTNIGLNLNYLNSVGHYANQSGKLFNGSVFGSYDGDHYGLHASFMWATLSAFDNGGLRDCGDMGGVLKPEDIPVRLNAMQGYRYLCGYLHHGYSITREQEVIDSIAEESFGMVTYRDTVRVQHVPILTFSHVFDANNSNRRYVEHQANQGFYPDTYSDQSQTNDSTDVFTLRNTLAVTFNEAFNTKLKFGAQIYAINECQRYLQGFPRVDSLQQIAYNDTTPGYHWTNNTYLGGALYKREGSYIRYGVEGDVCLLGYKLGEFHVNGNVLGEFHVGKDTMSIEARAYVRNETPSYYLQHYVSNHVWWNNDFQKTYRFYVGGTWAYPTKWVKSRVTVGFEDLMRYVYFADDLLPHQYDGHVQVISADVQCDVTTPWVNLENRVVYQHSSSEVLPLPMFALHHNLYYHGTWFRALDAQIGVDMRFFTKYKAPVFCPTTGQFMVQNTEEIGNYPVLDVYANFYVRLLKLKFFAHYTHFNYLFMKKNKNFFAMPGYPLNPDVFRAGLAWHFYR